MAQRSLGRREFLRATLGVGAAAPLLALMERSSHAIGLGASSQRPGRQRGPRAEDNGGYGPLQTASNPIYASSADADRPWLALPAGFTYAAFGHTGETMSDGNPTPAAHDGMAAFPGPAGDQVWLIRNHELDPGQTPPVVGPATYDGGAAGGTTSLLFDLKRTELVDHFASIAGTTRNCAGGPTPWGSWLTCEETFDDGPSQPHGYIFEVPTGPDGARAAEPLVGMGRFVHEAVAIDPDTGVVYETEDQSAAGFYRFIPHTPGTLSAGGRLQMLAVRDRDNFDTRTGQRVGRALPVRWVDIDDPDPHRRDGVYRQGYARGGATFGRLEGAWWGEGAAFIVSTSGGDAGVGQVWQYRPSGNSGGQLRLVFESPGPDVLDRPDTITVSPNGGLVLCEDGAGTDFLRGITRHGEIFDLARNDHNTSELAGATFSPEGSTLFFNIQNPGLTLAITGPWDDGAL